MINVIKKCDFSYNISAEHPFEQVARYDSTIEKLLANCEILTEGERPMAIEYSIEKGYMPLGEYAVYPVSPLAKVIQVRPFSKIVGGKIQEIKSEDDKTLLKFEDWDVIVHHQAD